MKKYKFSEYNFFKFKENDCVIYNSRTGAVIALKDVDFDINQLNNNWIDEIISDEDLFNLFLSNGIILEETKNELDMVKSVHINHVNNLDFIEITLMPTTGCNFKCPYCFVYEKDKENISKLEYDKIYKYIFKKIEAIKNKNEAMVAINWFGGEPTLMLSDIVSFNEKIKDLCELKSVNFYSGIVTNGFLLNVNNFKRLLHSGITDFQVTIDGDKMNHDKYRILKNGEGTFNIIFENLINISKLTSDYDFRMSIRCNFTKSGKDSMETFIGKYNSNFSKDDRFSIYFRPVYYYETLSNSVDSISEDLYNIEDGLIEQNRLARIVMKYEKKDLNRRLFSPLPQPTKSWCNADCKNHVIIGPKSKIYMCDTMTGNDHVVGYLSDDGLIEKNEKYDEWHYDIFDDIKTHNCLSCKLLPICFGQCRRLRLKNSPNCYWKEKNIFISLDEYYDMFVKNI